MSHWLPLKISEDAVELESVTRDGVHITLVMSPFDIPEAVRGSYDDESGLFSIEFRYPVMEKKTTRAAGAEHVTLVVGKNSERLYRIEIDVRSLGANQVTLQTIVPHQVQKAIEDFAPQAELRRDNLKLLDSLLESRREDVYRDLPVLN